VFVVWRLVEVPDGASLGETHDEAAVLADHQGDLVSSEAPLTVHLALLLLKLGVLTERASELFSFGHPVSPSKLAIVLSAGRNIRIVKAKS
jgi:hypothetical protein